MDRISRRLIIATLTLRNAALGLIVTFTFLSFIFYNVDSNSGKTLLMQVVS